MQNGRFLLQPLLWYCVAMSSVVSLLIPLQFPIFLFSSDPLLGQNFTLDLKSCLTFIFALSLLSACSQSVRFGFFFSLWLWHTTVWFPLCSFWSRRYSLCGVCFLESYLFAYLLKTIKWQWNLFCNMNSYSFMYYWQAILETITMDKDTQWSLIGSEWLTTCC